MNKAEQLELVLLNCDPHVMVVTETWLGDLAPDNGVFSESDKMFRGDHPTPGGGVAFVLRDSVNVSLLK